MTTTTVYVEVAILLVLADEVAYRCTVMSYLPGTQTNPYALDTVSIHLCPCQLTPNQMPDAVVVNHPDATVSLSLIHVTSIV